MSGFLINSYMQTPPPSLFPFSTIALLLNGDNAVNNATNNTFADVGPNALTMSSVGTPFQGTISPFTTTSDITATTTGGSVYLNGSTDYLTAATSAGLGLGTGDFTIECWFYITNATKANACVVDFRTSGAGSSQAKPTIYMIAGSLSYYTLGGTKITQAAIVSNQWYHVAVVRTSGITKMYVNGTAVATTYTDANNYGSSNDIVIGEVGDTRTFNAFFPGYITQVRVVKGTAVYTSNFTVPTTPLSAIANTTFLFNGFNAGAYDASGKNNIISSGNAKISTAVKKYGSGSLSFDGVTASCYKTLNAPVLGTSDFTIEAWVNLNSLPNSGVHAPLVGRWGSPIGGSATQQQSWVAAIYSSGSQTQLRLLCSTDGTITTQLVKYANVTINTGTWYHIAVVRSGANILFFLNGILQTTQGSSVITTSTSIFGSTAPLYIGASNYNTAYYMNGYMDELRITLAARYTASFEVPTALPTH